MLKNLVLLYLVIFILGIFIPAASPFFKSDRVSTTEITSHEAIKNQALHSFTCNVLAELKELEESSEEEKSLHQLLAFSFIKVFAEREISGIPIPAESTFVTPSPTPIFKRDCVFRI